MKKLISAILLTVMLVSVASVANAAYPSEVSIPKTATAITIDGVKDDAYGLGFEFSPADVIDKTSADIDYAYPVGDARTSEYSEKFSKLSSTGYFAWDEKYLYGFITVTEPDQVKMTDAATFNKASRIEFMVYEYINGSSSYNKLYFALDSEGKAYHVCDASEAITNENMKAALTVDGDKINYEFCIEWAVYGIEAKVGAETKIGFAHAAMDPGYTTYAFGGCFSRRGDLGIKTVLADAPVKEEPKDEPKDEKPVETGDALVFAVLALVVSVSAGIVVAKKAK